MEILGLGWLGFGVFLFLCCDGLVGGGSGSWKRYFGGGDWLVG